MSADVKPQPAIETEVALLRQSLELNTETLKELRTDMKQSYALFATKAELANVKAQVEKEIVEIETDLKAQIGEVRDFIKAAVKWLLSIIGAITVAMLLAFFKFVSPHL